MPEQKAEIFRVDNPGKKVVCQFNPKDFSITKSIKWVYQTADGKNVGDPEFAGGEAQDLTVDLVRSSKTFVIYATQSQEARIALFGPDIPISCRDRCGARREGLRLAFGNWVEYAEELDRRLR